MQHHGTQPCTLAAMEVEVEVVAETGAEIVVIPTEGTDFRNLGPEIANIQFCLPATFQFLASQSGFQNDRLLAWT